MSRLAELGDGECIQLLRAHPRHVGRVGFYSQDGLTILPVNYRVFGGEVVFHTDPGSLLFSAVMQDRVAFEVDDVTPSWREGWSVLVRGTAREVTDAESIEAIERLVRSWAGRDSRTIAITPDQITGRRIV
ncbi:pyridoxamine 5'-phosphate oxidase family protein [Euzebya tangerina]|uniref:pyridoxamine 5'-phosphate oxidase family protein n=1 Tax=Euzebya tangerina TaxID=591198 RepID=UPI0013C34966|nr:pyridoxamine 5'-phosphate oxidase family protein [Euzebya tangerina]